MVNWWRDEYSWLGNLEIVWTDAPNTEELMFAFFFSKKKEKKKPHEHIGCPTLGSAGVFHSLQRQDRHDENISGGWTFMG